MSHNTLKLSDQKVLDEAREALEENLPLEAAGYVCTTDDLYNVLLGVAPIAGRSKRSARIGSASLTPKPSGAI